MTRLYYWCKKIHRIFVLIIIVLTIIMAVTGLMMKYGLPSGIRSLINLGAVRYLHNQLSVLFTAALTVMILTGVVMYVYPWYVRRRVNAGRQNETDTTV